MALLGFRNLFGEIPSILLLLFVLQLRQTSAQGFLELTSYEELTNFVVNDDGLVAAVMNFSHCETNFPLEDTSSIVTMDEFRKWVYYKDTAGTADVLRLTQYFLNEEGLWSFLKIEATSDDTASMWINVLSNTTADSVVQLAITNCPFGSGAKFLAKNADVEYEKFQSYEDLKAALLAGRTIRTKPNITACANVPWTDNGVDILFGSTIADDWEITQDDAGDELIHISYNFWVDYFVSGPVGAESIDIWIRPDGEVQMTPKIVDFLTWSAALPFPEGYVCQLGESFQAVAPAVSGELVIYTDYESVKAALTNGTEMEVIVETGLCEWSFPNGEEALPQRIGHRSFSWDLHNDQSGAKDYAQFYSILFTEEGQILHSQYGVMEDNTVQAIYHVLDRASGESSRWIAICPLGTGAVLRSSHHQKSPLESYSSLKEAVSAGSRVVFQILLDECDGVIQDTGVIVGGSLSDVNIRVDAESEYVSFSVVDLAYDATSGLFIWGTLNVIVEGGLDPDEGIPDVNVTLRGFEADTGVDVYGGNAQWSCYLNQGAVFLV